LRRWIAQGAKTARPEPADPRQARFTEEELSFWAFQPVRRPALPCVSGTSVRTPVDAFLAAKLHERGLSFSPEADKRTLIRRATYDLHGLPPTPEEVEAFLRDDAPDAYERLIDRLLASPQYGERWGRHWLDVAGYAESDGNPGRDRTRPYAYRYRDYVIRSYNADKPFDQFLREQLAGDELARRPLDPSDPATVELLTATGFLRMAPDVTETADTLADRNQAVAETLKVVTSAVLGLTVGCAQCHDHRYDPISQEDYYRLRAVFDPAFDLKRWQKPSQRRFDITSADTKAAAASIEAEAKRREADIQRRAEELGRVLFEREVAKILEPERAAARQAVETPAGRRDPAQIALLKRYPSLRDARAIARELAVYDPKASAAFDKERQAIAQFRASRPPDERVMAVLEPAGPVPESRVFYRGNPDQPRQAVRPGELAIVSRHRPAETLPDTDRRLAYARWLTEGTHPLVARVIVNRIWMHHFGIVRTPGDFGTAGGRPSHPELLDWLADDFVRGGWRLKRLHKLLLTSAAYRQSSHRTPALDQVDPDNRLLGRMRIRRLDAEAVRDTLLAVSGDLNLQMFGRSVPVAEDSEGRVVLGRESRRRGGDYAKTADALGPLVNRRSVYVEAQRALPLGMLEAFDLPVMTPNCEERRCSTVATQSLVFLNDRDVVAPAQRLADRLARERPNDPDAQVRRAFVLLFAAEPEEAEVRMCRQFLGRQTECLRTTATPGAKDQPDPERLALASLCRTLFCTNRFLYVD
jgi:hypothetical protein